MTRRDMVRTGGLLGLVLLVAGLLSILAAGLPQQTPAKTYALGERRVVSLDVCADQYALALLPPGDIVGLSPHAKQAYSYERQRAADLPTVSTRPEHVLALRPTHVLRTYGGGPSAGAFYERAGVTVIDIGFPQSLDELTMNLSHVADELGALEKVAPLSKKLIGLQQDIDDAGDASDRTTLYLTPGGVSPGTGTLINDLMEAAGHTNFLQDPGWQTLSLEEMVASPPDHFVTAFFDDAQALDRRWYIGGHSVLKDVMDSRRITSIPADTVSCATWAMADAVDAMQEGTIP